MAYPTKDLQIKVISFDSANLNVICKFWSPESKKSIDEYEPISVAIWDIPITSPEGTPQEEIILEYLKEFGMSIIQSRHIQEAALPDKESLETLLTPNRTFNVSVPDAPTTVDIVDVVDSL
jgi:hypothetical protein